MTFMRLVRIDAPSGQEGQIQSEIQGILREIGISHRIAMDLCYRHFSHHGVTGTCGNLYVTLPATPGYRNISCLGFNAHLDRVEPGRGINPRIIRVAGRKRIVSDGTTILAGDCVAGITVLLAMVKALHDKGVPHGKIQLIFTACEETKLLGSRYLRPSLLHADMVYSFDGGDPGEVRIAVPSSDKLDVLIHGRTAHGGVHPEQGIPALLILAQAMSDLYGKGHWGRIVRSDQHAASVNLVIDHHQPVGANSVQAEIGLKGDIRSFNSRFLDQLTRSVRRSCEKAVRQVQSSDGSVGSVEFTVDRAYNSFRVPVGSDIVRRAVVALGANGVELHFERKFMGADACWLNQYCPTIVMGMGAHKLHTQQEFLALEEFFTACDIAISLATAA